MLNAIRAKHLFAVPMVNDSPVSCGVGVLHNGLFGIFDIVTACQTRNQGLGYDICQALLGWAFEQGGKQAYLQVVAENKAAIRLYKKLGFHQAYHYWYRVHPTAAQ